MKIKAQHFHSIPSTQLFLKENVLPSDDHFLVSTDWQSSGIGRSENTWYDWNFSLAFSFTLQLPATPSLGPLELAVLVIQFFSEKLQQKLYLKWPNDILNQQGEKCGGLILHGKIQGDEQIFIAGIGLNLFASEQEKNQQRDRLASFKSPFGTIFQQKDHFLFLEFKEKNPHFRQILPLQFYEFFLQNRLRDQEIITLWSQNCFHLHRLVQITEDDKQFVGLFQGINEGGAALVQNSTNQEMIVIQNGHLLIL